MKSNADQRFSQDQVADAIEIHLRQHGEKGIEHADSAFLSPDGTREIVLREKKALWPRRKNSYRKIEADDKAPAQES